MKKEPQLQDLFLSAAMKSGAPVTLFLMNGFQMRGVVRGYDPFTVVLDADGRQNLIYKHAISTLCPLHPLPMDAGSREG